MEMREKESLFLPKRSGNSAKAKYRYFKRKACIYGQRKMETLANDFK